MKPSKVASGAITLTLFLGAIVIALIALASHGRKVLAREAAQASLSLVERKILEGSKSYWKIPAYPDFLTLEFEAGQLSRFWERTQDDREVNWEAPYENRVLEYEVVATHRTTGKRRLIWGHLDGQTTRPKEYRAGNSSMPQYDLLREALVVRVSQKAGPPTYLHLDMRWVPESFGFKGGPLGNKKVP